MLRLLLSLLLLPQAGGPHLNLERASKTVLQLHRPAAGGATLVGTGFLVALPDALYLVTAEHVALQLGTDLHATYGEVGDRAKTLTLLQLTGSTIPEWTYHGVADVAVMEIQTEPDTMALLRSRALEPARLLRDLEAPPRERPLTVVGFPLGFGALVLGPESRVSPLSRMSFAASGLLTLRRIDTKTPMNFFLLDSPSIGGFSGAPVFLLPAPFTHDGGLAFSDAALAVCVGLVHGTLGDDTGGKLAAIVPVSYIVETLEKAYRRRKPAT
jgi:hypothetical protein